MWIQNENNVSSSKKFTTNNKQNMEQDLETVNLFQFKLNVYGRLNTFNKFNFSKRLFF